MTAARIMHPGIIVKACPQCLDDKAMCADRNHQTVTCRICGRTWRDGRVTRGRRITFIGIVRSTWHEDPEGG